MLVNLVVGDWSRDGHEKTSNYTIEVENIGNKTGLRPDITQSYLNGVANCGFDVTKFCDDYEDSSISKELYDFGKKHGITYSNEGFLEEDEYSITEEDYVDLWILIFNFNKNNLVARLRPVEDHNIGGYGLFF